MEQVLALVEQIPPGRVATYGDLAELVGRGGPRGVGRVMSYYGSAVPWWRVIRADGRPAACHEHQAVERLSTEGCPLKGERVVLASARWEGPALTARER